jgi:hypothetical protein
MVFLVLVVSASCAHPHEPGAIDTPISFWNSWYDTCRIHRACKPVKPMPRCPTGLLASAARKAFTTSKDNKDVRSVVGTLRSSGGSCTKMACEIEGKPQWQVCCNGCGGRVLLVGEDGSPVGLTGEKCVGDESRLCCTIDVHGQKIIATGVLVEGPKQGSLWLKDPYDLCAL